MGTRLATLWLLAAAASADDMRLSATAAAQSTDTIELTFPARLDARPVDGTAVRFAFALRAGEAVTGRIEQRGLDVVVEIRDAAGALQFETDSPNGAHGPEPVAWIAPTKGTYILAVRPFEGGRGVFDLRLDARPATPADRGEVEALALYRRAFSGRENALRHQGRGEFGPATAAYGAARDVARRALEMRRELSGEQSPALIPLHQLLGLIDDEVGDYADGERHFAIALRLLEKQFGAGHVATQSARSDLGYLRAAAGNYAGAVKLFDDVRTFHDTARDPEAAEVRIPLGLALLSSGDAPRAERVLREALALFERTPPRGSSSMRRTRIALGLTLVQSGDAAGARTACLAAAATLPAPPGLSGQRADIETCLAKAALNSLDYAAATQHAAAALDLRERAYGPEHPLTAEALVTAATAQACAGDVNGARARLQSALAVQRRRLGPDHPSTVATARALSGTR